MHPASSSPIASKIGDTCWKRIKAITPSGIAIIKDEECEPTRPKVMTICTHIGDPILEKATIGEDMYFVCLNGHIKMDSGEEHECDGRVYRLDGRVVFGNETLEKPNNRQNGPNTFVVVVLFLVSVTMITLALIITYQRAAIATLREKLRVATTSDTIQLVNFGLFPNRAIDPDSETVNLIENDADSVSIEVVEPEEQQQRQQSRANLSPRQISAKSADAAQLRIGTAHNERIQQARREAEVNIMDRPIACIDPIDVDRPDISVNMEETNQPENESANEPPPQASVCQPDREDGYRTKSGRISKKTKTFGF